MIIPELLLEGYGFFKPQTERERLCRSRLGGSGAARKAHQRGQEGAGEALQNRKWKFKFKIGSGRNRWEALGEGVGVIFF